MRAKMELPPWAVSVEQTHQPVIGSSLWLACCAAGNGGQNAQRYCMQGNIAADLRARKVRNFHNNRNWLEDRHGNHASLSADVLKAANAKILDVNDTSIGRQRRRNVVIWHMKRGRVNKDIFKVFICRSKCNIDTTKIKAIKIIIHLIGGRGKLNAIFLIRQCLNSTHSLGSDGLN